MFPFAIKLPFPSNLQNKEKHSNNVHPEKHGKPRNGMSLMMEEHPSTALYTGVHIYTVVAQNRDPSTSLVLSNAADTHPLSRLTNEYKQERNKRDSARSNLCNKVKKKALGNQFF